MKWYTWLQLYLFELVFVFLGSFPWPLRGLSVLLSPLVDFIPLVIRKLLIKSIFYTERERKDRKKERKIINLCLLVSLSVDWLTEINRYPSAFMRTPPFLSFIGQTSYTSWNLRRLLSDPLFLQSFNWSSDKGAHHIVLILDSNVKGCLSLCPMLKLNSNLG